MTEDWEFTTTASSPDYIFDDFSKQPQVSSISLNIQPRKISKKVIESKELKIFQLKRQILHYRLDNEKLKTENQSLKQNIEVFRGQLFNAREEKKMKANSNFSIYTMSMGLIIACTLHFQVASEASPAGLTRKLLFHDSLS